MSKLRFSQVLLKISGEALAGGHPFGIDNLTITNFCRDIVDAAAAGASVVRLRIRLADSRPTPRHTGARRRLNAPRIAIPQQAKPPMMRKCTQTKKETQYH